jgi:hypothetical protein
VTQRLPTGVPLEAERLAFMGPGCMACNRRHICPVYRSNAPGLWTHTEHQLPLDTWGSVEGVDRRADGSLNLILRDAADRRVRVFGVQARAGIEVGAKLWFFGLESSDISRAKGAWRQPQNFFEVADDGRRRAWSLAIFGPSSSGRATGRRMPSASVNS